MCHPEQVRSLSIRECARLQGFPDEWVLAGSAEAQFRQIGNAVPVHLGEAIGRAFLSGARAQPEELKIDAMLAAAIARLRASARNKVKPRKPNPYTAADRDQTVLFE